MIVAKAVIPNQYWILKQDDRKVGNIEAGPDGFQVKINNEVQKYKTLNKIQQRVAIDFQPIIRSQPKVDANEVNGFPTTSKPYNAIYDVRHQIPLWTRDSRSKSWYAAGWYLIKQGRNWTTINCPKLIILERYKYQGPFCSEDEAKAKA